MARQTGGEPRRRLDKYIPEYIPSPMAERARIFQNGGSQAVRLPKSCRFTKDQDQVIVRKVGKQVILEPADEWPPEFLACLGAWHDDIPKSPVRKVGSRRNPFES
jgi:antitoxin VapB